MSFWDETSHESVRQNFQRCAQGPVDASVKPQIGDFERFAAKHVNAMMSALILEHNTIVRSLQTEVSDLREQLSGTKDRAKQVNTTSSCNDNMPPESNQGTSDVLRSTTEVNAQPHQLQHEPDTQKKKPLKSVAASLSWGQSLEKAPTTSEKSDMKKTTRRLSSTQTVTKHPSCVQRFVLSNVFEILTGAIIIANTVMMSLQLQYDGFDIGHTIRPEYYTLPAEDVWPGADSVFSFLDFAFNVLFGVELLLRYYGNGLQSFRMPWMWFDTTIVVMGWVDALAGGADIGFDPTIIRIVRLVRLVRLMKIFKALSSVDSLFLLIKAIYACSGALTWSFLLLIGVQIGSALFLSQMLQPFIKDEAKDIDARTVTFNYFGTFSRSIVTMTEITLANWSPSCRFLFEEVHETTFLFYMVYRCMFCFCVLRVIAAVFITETNRVLADDAELTLIKYNREKHSNMKKFNEIFNDIDVDGDGVITSDELDIFLKNEELAQWLATVQLDKSDVEKLFWLLEADGSVDKHRFLTMVGKLKGNAKTVDLLDLFKFVHKMDVKLERSLGIEETDASQEALVALAEERFDLDKNPHAIAHIIEEKDALQDALVSNAHENNVLAPGLQPKSGNLAL